jgi:SAM-dependent MidA family methyltransferase
MIPLSLADRLAAEIAASGPLRFDRYMARALFEPALGYYASGRARIGRTGDFYTSVSVGRMFGRALAAQCAEVWERMGHPARFDIVEQGANDARLAADILDALRERVPACYEATRYTLIEPFPALAETQHRTLASHPSHAHWIPAIEELDPFTGVHLTNEYADALPVRLFLRAADGWLERHVAWDGDQLVFDDRPTEAAAAHLLPCDVTEGYLAELRPEAEEWITALAGKLDRGLLLVIDYGFPRSELHAPWRTSGTLSCYRSHRRDDDPLEAPGEKDITAHVDFTSLARAGQAAGLDLAGFADQHHFMVGAATPLLLEMEASPTSSRRDADFREIKTLLHPETMGTQFKYLALARDIDLGAPLAGFRHARDAAARLGLTS